MRLILKAFKKIMRNEFYLLVLMMFMSAILETLSIGLFIPVITLLTNNDIFETYPKLEFLINFMGEPTKQNQILLFLDSFFLYLYSKIFSY